MKTLFFVLQLIIKMMRTLDQRDISRTSLVPRSPLTANVNNSNWLSKFCLPTRWEPAVEEALKRQELNPNEKNALNRQLTSSILAHTESPTVHERKHIALMLIQKYPFLKGSFGSGHQLWANKIADRVLSLRRRASQAQKRKRLEEGVLIPKGKPGRKSKKSACNSLPSLPEGETKAAIVIQQKQLVEMFNIGSQDLSKINVLMNNTFAHRRRDILVNNTRVWKLLHDYPFFKHTKGVELKAELGRILEKSDVVQDMKEQWNLHKYKMLSAIKNTKQKNVSSILEELEDCPVEEEEEVKNWCIMACLPFVLDDQRTHQDMNKKLFWDIVDG
ncbi:uncharacterized protein LOC124458470 [Xenia sp. Carnegie-2017]|uniref:uncharacterized protein LOC124458470 n=1 Tax=Xenia sp. Carnegie-2017 TaxID=2897299 RepID=UPI001F044742|nr:uncharacterized protein LOC124458470 [Xenia sp. Carnegie-2017]XP_046864438.1 uncharacterized protein LOC124458470 [Xenia sp. Carnegie-2017]